MSSVGILGTGTWGIALGRLLANNGHGVTMWSALPEEIEELRQNRSQKNLPGVTIPEAIRFTGDLSEACEEKDLVVFAVPSVYVRATARRAKPFITAGQLVADAAKGIEAETLMTLSEVLREELAPGVRLTVLSGPTHAEEVARDRLTAIVAASDNEEDAKAVQAIFMSPAFRVYTNTDMRGAELCGALKNIIALAAGISDGLGQGDNARAALITRGLAEMERLGQAMGMLEGTFAGLTGMGDLIVTCTSRHSRNHRAGALMGSGIPPREAIRQVGMVVEGVNALPAAVKLGAQYGVELPIISAVDAVVNGRMSPAEAVRNLMLREGRSEMLRGAGEVAYEQAIVENATRQRTGDAEMKRVITYGTFDLLHYGHINLLRRAKALGDYLIVVLSSDEFNWREKGKRCYFTYEQRKALLESIRYVDLVIPEENWEQKRTDVHEYHIDTFVMGDDWAGKFDFLREEGVEVVYLPRTPEISTTQIKHDLGK